MLRFPRFYYTIFDSVGEIIGIFYLAVYEGFAKTERPNVAIPALNQKIPFKSPERCVDGGGIETTIFNESISRNRRLLHNMVINQPVRILFFHLYLFLMVANKGFALVLKKGMFFTIFFKSSQPMNDNES
jgi:hypothetical protein